MQKRVFPLWGVAGVGKTSTLKLIAREIMRRYFTARSSIELEPLPEGDITVIITIQMGDRQIKIGITSKGDPNTDLLVRLEELSNVGCEIIFCATRTSGTTVENVSEFERRHNFRATWVTNYQSGFIEERPYLNQKSAEELVNLMTGITGV